MHSRCLNSSEISHTNRGGKCDRRKGAWKDTTGNRHQGWNSASLKSNIKLPPVHDDTVHDRHYIRRSTDETMSKKRRLLEVYCLSSNTVHNHENMCLSRLYLEHAEMTKVIVMIKKSAVLIKNYQYNPEFTYSLSDSHFIFVQVCIHTYVYDTIQTYGHKPPLSQFTGSLRGYLYPPFLPSVDFSIQCI